VKFVRLTIEPPEPLAHPMQEFLASTDAVYGERLLGWSIPDDREVWYLLIHVEGDLEPYRQALVDAGLVESYDLTPAGEQSFYAYVVERIRPEEKQLLDAFADRNLVLVPPVDFSPDGRPTYTVVGPAEDQQRMLEALPGEFVADVERIGEYDHRYTGLAGRVTDRQREAVRTAYEVGYYDVPRDATLEDVADQLDCSGAGASKLLRRAEAAVMSVVLDG